MIIVSTHKYTILKVVDQKTQSPHRILVTPTQTTKMHFLGAVEAFSEAQSLLGVAGALVIGAAFIAYQDYRSYVALGPHGLPATFWGWCQQLQMTRNARKDTTVPAPYDFRLAAGAHDGISFLPQAHAAALSWRPGNMAPQIPGFVAPQRQVTDQATAATKQALYRYLDALATANPKVLQIQTSVLEGPVPAMGLRGFANMADRSRPSVLTATRGELCHIHPPDGSMHLILSLTDQKRVMELGWGRRHRLSGGGMLPWNYTFIYAPRDQEEIKAWQGIVIAAARFCCAGVTEVKAPE